MSTDTSTQSAKTYRCRLTDTGTDIDIHTGTGMDPGTDICIGTDICTGTDICIGRSINGRFGHMLEL